MQSFFLSYFQNLQELHAEIRSILQSVPQDAIDWTPGEAMNSLGVLVVHTLGSERYWIGTVAAQDALFRDRDAEFTSKGLTAETLLQHLDALEGYFELTLARFDYAILEAMRIAPRDQREVSVGWALMHAITHAATHVGHMHIIQRLWEQREVS